MLFKGRGSGTTHLGIDLSANYVERLVPLQLIARTNMMKPLFLTILNQDPLEINTENDEKHKGSNSYL